MSLAIFTEILLQPKARRKLSGTYFSAWICILQYLCRWDRFEQQTEFYI